MKATIETEPSGLFFDFDDPRPEQVDVRDIARSLSMQCRFNGHATAFYSVAEHALLVHRLVQDAGHAPEVCYAALHHDSQEAYLGDVVTKLKAKLKREAPGVWEALSDSVDRAIAAKLGIHLDMLHHPAIKEADDRALRIEAGLFKTSQGLGVHWGHDAIVPLPPPGWTCFGWMPGWAEAEFLRGHREAINALEVAA